MTRSPYLQRFLLAAAAYLLYKLPISWSFKLIFLTIVALFTSPISSNLNAARLGSTAASPMPIVQPQPRLGAAHLNSPRMIYFDDEDDMSDILLPAPVDYKFHPEPSISALQRIPDGPSRTPSRSVSLASSANGERAAPQLGQIGSASAPSVLESKMQPSSSSSSIASGNSSLNGATWQKGETGAFHRIEQCRKLTRRIFNRHTPETATAATH